MAEKSKIAQVSLDVSANGSEPTEVCPFVGCIAHYEVEAYSRGQAGKDAPKVHYPLMVHYRNLDEVYKNANNSVKLTAELMARSGKPVSDGSKRIDVYADCTLCVSHEEQARKILALPPNEQAAAIAELKALLAAVEK